MSQRMAGSSGATMEVHFKLFGTDGVSLQSQELTKARREKVAAARAATGS